MRVDPTNATYKVRPDPTRILFCKWMSDSTRHNANQCKYIILQYVKFTEAQLTWKISLQQLTCRHNYLYCIETFNTRSTCSQVGSRLQSCKCKCNLLPACKNLTISDVACKQIKPQILWSGLLLDPLLLSESYMYFYSFYTVTRFEPLILLARRFAVT